MLLQIAQDLRQIAERIEGEIVGRTDQDVMMSALERFCMDIEKVYRKHGLCVAAEMRCGAANIMVTAFSDSDMSILRKAKITQAACEQLKLNDEPPF